MIMSADLSDFYIQVKAGYNPDTDSYEIITYNSYQKYDEVFISYGSHDNVMLLTEYGFCIRRNTNHCIEFTPGKLSKQLTL